MQSYKQEVMAGIVWAIAAQENFFQLVECPAPVTVRFMDGGRVVAESEGVEEGFYCKLAAWSRVEITSPVQQIIKVILSNGEAGSNRLAGSVRNLPKTADLIINRSGVAVNGTASIAVANRSRTVLRVLNTGPGFVALGAPGLKYSDAVILLGQGEMWQEAAAPGAEWVAVAQDMECVLKIQEGVVTQ